MSVISCYEGAVHDDSLREAAIQAEYETGIRESTERAAKAHVLVRLVRMTAGAIVCLAGIAMLVLPGPGLAVVAVGLAILARDVAWADRLLGHVRDRLPSDDDGGLTRGTKITMAMSAVAGVLGTIWFVTN